MLASFPKVLLSALLPPALLTTDTRAPKLALRRLGDTSSSSLAAVEALSHSSSVAASMPSEAPSFSPSGLSGTTVSKAERCSGIPETAGLALFNRLT
jgi:hypothetical protein